MSFLVIAALACVGLGCGIAILMVNHFLPKEDESLKNAGEIAELLPGMNCGACGQPGCFAYAQALAKDKDTITKTPCMSLMQDKENLKRLGEKLGMELDLSKMKKIAVIHCTGKSEILYDYKGINSCKGGALLSAGYKKCPYGCLGLGDCVEVCLQNAISIDKEKKIAVVNHEKCIGCGLCVSICPNDLIEIVPAEMPQYLGCNYLEKKNISGRERCDVGCIHCRRCVKVSEGGEVLWDEKKDLPTFDVERCLVAREAVEKCPRGIIIEV